MMTNQEALLTFRAGFNCLDVSLEEVINTIQLDAFKAGAEWAAAKVAIYDNPNDTWGGGLLFGRASSIRREISILKEIPK